MSNGPLDTVRHAVEQHDLPRALEAARRLLAEPGADRAQSHALCGKLEAHGGNPAAARAHLEQAAALGAQDAELCYLLGQLVVSEAPERALALLRGAVDLAPGCAWYHLAVGRALIATGTPAEAREHFLAAALDPRCAASALSGAVVAAAACGDVERALLAAMELLDAPHEAGAVTDAIVALVDFPDECPVDDLLDRLLRSEMPTAGLMLLASRRALGRRRLSDAIQYAEQALVLAPDGAEVRRVLGELLLLAEQPGRARAVLDCTGGAGMGPDTALALTAAARQQGHTREALALLEDTCRRYPEHAGAFIELSRALADAGRDADAEVAIRRALALDPQADMEAGRATRLLRTTLVELPPLLQALTGSRDWEVRRTRLGHNALLVQVRRGDRELFAKVYLPGARSKDHVEETSALVAAAHAASPLLAVPQPLASADGRRAFPVAGGTAKVLAAIPGVSLRRSLRDPRADVTPAHARSLGEALALLHDVLDRVTWRRSSDPGLSTGLRPFREWMERDTAEADLRAAGADGSVAARIARVVDRLLPRVAASLQHLPSGTIHGDFGWHNATWSGTSVVGVVDFDYATWDGRAVDLCNAIHRTAFDWKHLLTDADPRPRTDIARAIVNGYTALRPLPVRPEDLDAIFAAVRVQYYLAMARAARPRDPRTPSLYMRGSEALRVLAMQLDWLSAWSGLAAMVL